MWDWFGVVVLLVVVYVGWFVHTTKQRLAIYAPIPGPPVKYFLIGNISSELNIPDQWNVFEALAKKYGPIFKFQSFTGIQIFINDAKLIEEILVQGQNNYSVGHEWGRADYREYADVFGKIVTNTTDNDWKWRRPTLLPSFSNSNLYALVPGFIQNKTDELVDSLKKTSGTVVELDNIFCLLTTHVISYIIFGREISNSGCSSLFSAIDVYAREMHRRSYTWTLRPLAEYTQTKANTTKLLKQLIKDSKKDSKNTLLDKMLQQTQYNEDSIADEVLGLIFAGHDTTAHTMAFALSLLIANPKKKEKLKKEIDEVLSKKGNGPWNGELLGQFVYLNAVIRETLRIYPIAPAVAVKPRQNLTTGGYFIPKGTAVVLNFRAVSADSNIYPQAEKFRPERFIPGHPKETNQNLLSFSLGAHQCLGKNLAYIEAKIVLSNLLSKFNFQLAPGYVVQTEAHVTIRPLGGMKMIVEPIQ